MKWLRFRLLLDPPSSPSGGPCWKRTDSSKQTGICWFFSVRDVWNIFVLQIVVTKVDKCGPRTLLTNLLDLQEVINVHTKSCFPQPFLVR